MQDGRLWSSAGVTSGIDLALSLLERLTSAQCAAQVARNMVCLCGAMVLKASFRPGWPGAITCIQRCIGYRMPSVRSPNWDGPWINFGGDCLCHCAPSDPSFSRADWHYPDALSDELRLALASSLLQQQGMTLDQVAKRVGLGDAHQLRRVWHRHRTGTPGEWRQQTRPLYNGEGIAD